MHRSPRFLVAAATLAATTSAALAADRRVGPGETYATIQAAVDAASPGDRIVLGARTYVENVVASKERLTFLGTQGTVWDGTLDASTSGTCLTAAGDGTVVQGIVFRAGSGHLRLSGAGVRVTRCESLRCDGIAFSVTGARTRIESCVVRSSGGLAIQLIGANDALVSRCRIVATRSTAISADGAGVTVATNTLLGIGADGIYVFGDGAKVLSNSISGVDSDGIQVSGADATVTANKVTYADAEGIEVHGDGARVEKNSVLVSLDTGVQVSGRAMFVARNRVGQQVDDSLGFDLVSDTTGGGRVERNIAVDCADAGFDCSTTNVAYLANKAIRCGAEDEGGFRVSGNANTFTSCVAQECDGPGFRVAGDGHVLTKCTSVAGTSAGFLLFGVGNQLVACTSARNDAEGLVNHGTDTDLVGGSYLGNGIDVTRGAAGTWGRFEKPRFSTGGRDTIAEQN